MPGSILLRGGDNSCRIICRSDCAPIHGWIDQAKVIVDFSDLAAFARTEETGDGDGDQQHNYSNGNHDLNQRERGAGELC
jgi:hypothetical protein